MIYKTFVFDSVTCIAMEYLPGWINLYKYLCQRNELSETSAKIIFKQVVTTIVEMTGWMGIVHGDIKDHNILINPNTLDIKIIDFCFTYKTGL